MIRFARCLTLLAATGLVLAVAGCEGGKKTAQKKDPNAQPRDTLGKTTQKVYDLKEELSKGGVVSDGKVDVSTPIIGAAGAYAPIVGKLGVQKAEMDIQQYYILNEKYPANTQEFLAEIIKVDKPDGVQLPMLPYYQEYAYDVDNHKLVVVEYPERKAARQRELNDQ